MEKLTPIIDTHAHLALLEHDSSQEILKRSWESGITKMITVSVDKPSWSANQKHAENHPDIYYSVGVHPHDASSWDQWKTELYSLFVADQPPKKCVAIGEMGMDFYYNNSPKELQIACFEEQLRLAKKVDLPIIIHCRDAFDELFSAIRREGLGRRGGVMHCFTGGPPEAKDAVELGLKISFSGILTFKSAQPLRDAALSLPLSEIVVETDCPFLAPIPMRGKPNEPSFLPHTVRCLASTLSKDPQEIAEQTTKNAIDFFQLH